MTYTKPQYQCEAATRTVRFKDIEYCAKPATAEYTLTDEDDVYQTYRCDEHPVTNPSYERKEV